MDVKDVPGGGVVAVGVVVVVGTWVCCQVTGLLSMDGAGVPGKTFKWSRLQFSPLDD